MPWKVTNVMDQRIKFVAQAIRNEVRFSSLCRQFGISRPTGYRWLHRYEETGRFGMLVDRSRRPHHSPNQTPPEVEERVIELRQEYGWGGKKLRVKLAEEGLNLSIATVNRIIKRNGLVDRREAHPPALRRFERSEPNELWQMDLKVRYKTSEGSCYPLSILDDHSRYVVGLHALAAKSAQEVMAGLIRTFEVYGVPEAMLMDHGTPWWSTTNAYGLTVVSIALINQGIALHYGAFGHPQTQGKVERFHRTLHTGMKHRGRPECLKEWSEAFEAFRYEYNHVRPHEALDMGYPVERYRLSKRAYQSSPPQWEYPTGSMVKQVDALGMINCCGKRCFVSEALVGQKVSIQEIDNRLLVKYRHMYVREIDLETGRSYPMVHPTQ